MEWLFWTLLAVGVVAVGGLVGMLCVTVPIARRVYREQLVRTTPDKWQRVCSAPENEEQMAMWEAGLAWGEENRAAATEVELVHDGLHLYGELFRFGGEKCVVILPGRCECLRYSYYFAKPYQTAGFNVLVIDPRAHGRSEGEYNTVGAKEAGDALAWVERLVRDYGMTEIWFHTICVGSAGAILAMADPACPPEVKGLVTEGCFVSFRETFKRHMVYDHRPLFPVLDLCMLNIRRYAGTDVFRTAPIRNVGRLRQRVLFLFGEQDVFSVPKMSRRLVRRCGSPDKKLVWFPKGGHSHLRLHDTEAYDRAIVDFLNAERGDANA